MLSHKVLLTLSPSNARHKEGKQSMDHLLSLGRRLSRVTKYAEKWMKYVNILFPMRRPCE